MLRRYSPPLRGDPQQKMPRRCLASRHLTHPRHGATGVTPCPYAGILGGEGRGGLWRWQNGHGIATGRKPKTKKHHETAHVAVTP